ncbi:MAG: phytoene/squalene synthase family protein [Pseudomonadota bacterium]|nr:phytoene/squalene synthase family protein [Pseudomonadota bacterium]
MDTTTSLDSLTAKWRARWPEWTLAMAFVPAAQRELVAAWFALLQELTDAAWGGSDPTPGLAKLAWWQEEISGWAKGAYRHPLGAVLQPRPAPWEDLARSIPSLQASRTRLDQPPAATAGFAGAVAACERALFDHVDAPAAAAADAAVVLDSLQGEHRLYHPDTAPAAAGEVVERQAATRYRRIHTALVRARLGSAGAASPPWRALLLAWRAARR